MSALFVDQLTVVDFSYLDTERGLVGETWIVDIELSGELDDQGMLVDFGKLKRQIRQSVDDLIDHKLLVPTGAAGIEIAESGSETRIRFPLAVGGMIEYSGPGVAVSMIDAAVINSDTAGAAVASILAHVMPENVKDCIVRLHPEPISEAYYHYSHGLKRHNGQCQRIAHGHRSRIQVLKNGVRMPEIEQAWAKKWKDIYIANREDITAESDRSDTPHLTFSYCSGEGTFSLTLPKKLCYLIDSDTTVENLATHVHSQLSTGTTESDHYLVKLFEGLNKGAVASD